MAVITNTTFSSAIETIWKKEIIPVAEGMMVLSNWGVSEGVPVNGGNTIRVNRVLRPSKVTAAKTPGTQVKLGDAGIRALTTNYRDFTLELWSSSFGINEDTDIVSFITLPKNQKTIANQMARTHEYQIQKRMAQEGLNWDVDTNAGADQKFGNVTADITATSTTFSTTLTDATGYWNKAVICFYNPESGAYDDAAYVTSFTNNTTYGTFVLSRAINVPTATTSKFIVTRRTGLGVADLVTVSDISDVAFVHEHLETPRFPGGVLRGVLSAQQHRDLRSDTGWQTFVQYDRSKTVENYLPGRWCDIEFLVGSEVYRSDVDGTENQATGLVHSGLIFGADSYATFRYGSGVGNFSSEWMIVDKPDSYNIDLAQKFLTWKTKWTGGVLRGTSVVAMNSGVTAYGFANIV